MRVDVNAFFGEYPFRRLGGGTPGTLLAAMDRSGIEEAWLSHLSAVFWRDPTEGNAALFDAAQQQPRFRPVPAVHPELPTWRDTLREASDRGAPCVRCDPTYYGLAPTGQALGALVAAAGELDLPLMLAVRLEDGRQRHPNDCAPELEAATIRELVRSDSRARLLVTHADRDFIEQVHFGSTPEEASRILWDICWIWGPPEDHLELLLRTVGMRRFTFGSGMPLRLPEASVAKLDLLDLTPEDRAALEAGNLRAFLRDKGQGTRDKGLELGTH